MPNINIAISDELHKKLKLKALMRDASLKDFFIDVLEKSVEKDAKTAKSIVKTGRGNLHG